MFQALTKLHHENVVAMYDCKVRLTFTKKYSESTKKILKLIILFFILSFSRCRNLITMSSWLWNIVTVETWEIT